MKPTPSITNLTTALLAEHCKAQADRIIAWIGDSQARFYQLMNIFTGTDKKLVQRAAWPMSYVGIAHPQLVKKHFPALIKQLAAPATHNAVRRNCMRLFQEVEIPRRYQGAVMNACFNYITNPQEKPAVKAFSLTVLENLAKQYPDILPEIKLIIHEQWDRESPAFRVRAKKMMRTM